MARGAKVEYTWNQWQAAHSVLEPKLSQAEISQRWAAYKADPNSLGCQPPIRLPADTSTNDVGATPRAALPTQTQARAAKPPKDAAGTQLLPKEKMAASHPSQTSPLQQFVQQQPVPQQGAVIPLPTMADAAQQQKQQQLMALGDQHTSAIADTVPPQLQSSARNAASTTRLNWRDHQKTYSGRGWTQGDMSRAYHHVNRFGCLPEDLQPTTNTSQRKPTAPAAADLTAPVGAPCASPAFSKVQRPTAVRAATPSTTLSAGSCHIPLDSETCQGPPEEGPVTATSTQAHAQKREQEDLPDEQQQEQQFLPVKQQHHGWLAGQFVQQQQRQRPNGALGQQQQQQSSLSTQHKLKPSKQQQQQQVTPVQWENEQGQQASPEDSGQQLLHKHHYQQQPMLKGQPPTLPHSFLPPGAAGLCCPAPHPGTPLLSWNLFQAAYGGRGWSTKKKSAKYKQYISNPAKFLASTERHKSESNPLDGIAHKIRQLFASSQTKLYRGGKSRDGSADYAGTVMTEPWATMHAAMPLVRPSTAPAAPVVPVTDVLPASGKKRTNLQRLMSRVKSALRPASPSRRQQPAQCASGTSTSTALPGAMTQEPWAGAGGECSAQSFASTRSVATTTASAPHATLWRKGTGRAVAPSAASHSTDPTPGTMAYQHPVLSTSGSQGEAAGGCTATTVVLPSLLDDDACSPVTPAAKARSNFAMGGNLQQQVALLPGSKSGAVAATAAVAVAGLGLDPRVAALPPYMQPKYGLRLVPRERVPHDHDRLFKGWVPWMHVVTRDLRSVRSAVPFAPGVYEWAARGPTASGVGGTGDRPIVCFYLGKAGRTIQGTGVGETLRTRFNKYVVGGRSHVGPAAEKDKYALFVELQRRGFSMFYRWRAAGKSFGPEGTFRELRYRICKDEEPLVHESWLLAAVDYAANLKGNGRRRALILDGGSKTLADFPVVVHS